MRNDLPIIGLVFIYLICDFIFGMYKQANKNKFVNSSTARAATVAAAAKFRSAKFIGNPIQIHHPMRCPRSTSNIWKIDKDERRE